MSPNTVEDGDFFVSPDGNDAWSGTRSEPTEDATDGPFATLQRAREAVRERRETALTGPVTVWLRGGRYELEEPLQFLPEDSGPVRFAAYADERPVVDGGRRIEGWEETGVNGVAAWVTHLPEVERGEWEFRQLFVNGERATRARLPKGDLADLDPEDFFWIEDVPGLPSDADMINNLFSGTRSFECRPGDIDPDWRNLSDVEIVALHYWIEERLPVESMDPETNVVTSSRRTTFAPIDDKARRYARYYVENVFEALTDPGEWYLDTSEGDLYYVPRDGEEPDDLEVVAPVTNQFAVVEGNPDDEEYVENIEFEGLTFRHAGWNQPTSGFGKWDDEDGVNYAAAPQAAIQIPGALSFEGARSCAVEDCTIEHVGWYGVELDDGCRYNRIVGNEIRDLGAGGVKLDGANAQEALARRTGHNRVTDNHIESGGRVFHSAIGVLARHTFDNDLSYNHIHDLYYSGISCGWTWGFEDNVVRDNRIEGNHIHDLGQGLLSDMGGIYTLGVQPGTVLRGNHIHDVEKHNYGGWAIYLDEGSSHILVEDNVCYDTTEYAFHQHYGRENVIRNNVFAFGDDGVVGLTRTEMEGRRWQKAQMINRDDIERERETREGDVPRVALSRGERGRSFTFERNVLLTDGEPLFVGRVGEFDAPLDELPFYSDLNLFWDVGEADLYSANVTDDETVSRTFDVAAWRELGYDCHSVVDDPRFADAESFDFSLDGESPAFDLGFDPVDVENAGPRRTPGA